MDTNKCKGTVPKAGSVGRGPVNLQTQHPSRTVQLVLDGSDEGELTSKEETQQEVRRLEGDTSTF